MNRQDREALCERVEELVLRAPWRLKDYDHIDTMVELVMEALQYDCGEED